MTRIKRSLGMFSGFLALTALGGCLTGDDPETSSSFSIAADAEVTDIIEPDEDAGEPGVLSTVSTTYYCDEGELEETETAQDFNYAITGGSLYLWYPDECTAMKFSGSSSDITGTWTSTSLSARIPSDYRPDSCEGVSPEDNYYEGFLDGATVTYTISSTEIEGEVSGTFCYGVALAEAYEDGEDITVVSSDCATVKLKNEDVDRTATITTTYADNELTLTLAYNGETCKVTYPVYLSTEQPTCSEEADEAYLEESEAFDDCLEDSEFNDDFNAALAKGKGNLPASIENALKRARPF